MKPVRSALLFVISVLVFSACFNPPEYNNVPSIEFEGVSFSKSPSGEDSLVVSVSFKDGDGDLGLSANSGPDTESPYHEINFFSNDNGTLYPINGIRIENFSGYTYKKAKTTPRNPSYYIEPEKATAELITLQSRNDGFTLPTFTPPYDCFLNEESYLNERQNPDTIFIFRENSYLIKDKMTIVDTLVRNGDPNEYYFVVVDYFYIKTNPYH